jgi:hypothetical protein
MWRLFNKWFGWDYASVDYGFSSYIRRVHKTPAGIYYVQIESDIVKLNHSRIYLPLTYVEAENENTK